MLNKLICIVIVMMTTGLTALADSTTQPASGDIVTRVYDISDLIWHKEDYVAPSQTDNGAEQQGAQQSNPSSNPTNQDLIDSIVKLLVDTVATDTWKDNGGTIGSMRELSGQLVVTQLAENHQKIQDVLDALRAHRGRMVVVRAYWLLLEPETVPPITSGKELPVIDDKLIDAKHLYCAGQTMCFSGQTVHVTSGRMQSVVADLTPVVGASAVGYNPTISSARSGVLLQVTPHLEPEGPDARCVLDLHSDVTEVGNVGNDKIVMPSTTEPSAAASSIDRLNEIRQEFRTTVRLPLSKKILVGGMTLEPAAKEDSGKQLYLVVEADAVK
jgi:type II secretory pathway component GspD/PulD (secretin)